MSQLADRHLLFGVLAQQSNFITVETANFLATLYLVSEWGVRLWVLFWVPTRRSPEAAKGWLLLILFSPWLGLLLYALIGRPYAPRWRRDRFQKLVGVLEPVAQRLRRHPNIFHPTLTPDLESAVALAAKLGHLPILGGNSAELLADYNSSINRLAADIDLARHHVHLLFYIFAADAATEPVLLALERAVQRGVTCRVLVDGLGSRKMIPALCPRLQATGVQCYRMLPTRLWGTTRKDLRNHRKIAVIDGRIGYTGSQNMISADFKEGITYEEMVVRVTGPIVLGLQFVFISDWYLETEEVLDAEPYFPPPEL